MNILLVDSEKVSSNHITSLLTMHGFTVYPARNTDEAFTIAAQHPIDVAIVELQTPGLLEEDVLQRAKEEYPHIPIIVMTAKATIEDVIAALRRRVKDYLLKPVSDEEIINSVHHVLAEASKSQLSHANGQIEVDNNGDHIVTMPNSARIDVEKHVIHYQGRTLVLTPTEARFMKVLLDQYGQVISHSEIVQKMYGYAISEEEAASVLRPIVSRLRKKLTLLPDSKDWIQTVRSSGYIFSSGKLS